MTISKKKLKVGQTIWVERGLTWFSDEDSPREIRQYEVVRVNGSSAYAKPLDEAFQVREDSHELRINQYTLKGIGNNVWDRVHRAWLYPSDFERDVEYQKEKDELWDKVMGRFDNKNEWTVNELKDLLYFLGSEKE